MASTTRAFMRLRKASPMSRLRPDTRNGIDASLAGAATGKRLSLGSYGGARPVSTTGRRVQRGSLVACSTAQRCPIGSGPIRAARRIAGNDTADLVCPDGGLLLAPAL